ncbi:cupredoxin domain-containing protein [Crenobacter cavernae]|uniref:Blue (type 1) copper domain-containing protein n=1 Tax=Crenobacter cavernae TaxID=2290923 RepID=A0A345Y2B9_9NEIS|nr:cupredoxin family protein [Crenobacter cavernae]AXK38071.1 hypothetical protein DWG20_00735 [Crenobacter cavernae]
MRFNKFVAPLVAVILSLPAMASGDHAGGHGAAANPHAGHDMQAMTLGQAGQSAAATRTIRIDADDSMRFTPDRVEVKQGETVRFIVTNKGQTKHEFALGTKEMLAEHAKQMQSNPGMAHGDMPAMGMLTLAPGESKTLVWRFTRTGEIQFGCNVPGHYPTMTGTLKVVS